MLAGLAAGLPLRGLRFAVPALRARVAAMLDGGRYDAVQVEELAMLARLPVLPPGTPLVYSAHNVESELAARLLGRLGPWLAGAERDRTERLERQALRRAAFSLAVSARDQRRLRALVPEARVEVLENGAAARLVPGPPVRAPELLFLGCLGWAPNRAGLDWFLRAVLPALRRRVPATRVRVVGSELGRCLAWRLRRHGVAAHADVPDVLPFLQRARLLVIPLLAGAGTRIKAIEAWAAGLPVVSTALGVEGLEVQPGVDALVADGAEEFARAVARVLCDDALYGALRSAGRARARALRWESLTARLEPWYRALVAQETAR